MTFRNRGVLLGLGMLVLSAQPVKAFEWQQDWSAVSYMQYDSNPLYLPNPQGVTVADLSPTWQASANSDHLSLNGKATMNLLRSSNPNLMVNRTDPDIVLGSAYTSQHSTTTLELDYNQMSTLPLGAAPGALAQDTVILADATRTTRTAKLGWTHDLDAYWTLDGNLNLSDVGFSQGAVGGVPAGNAGVQLTSYLEQQIEMGLTRKMTARLQQYVQFHAMRMQVSSVSGQNSWYELDTGVKWDISEAWSLDTYAGYSRLQNAGAVGLAGAGSQSGLAGSVDLEWLSEGDSFSVTAKRMFQDSGYGGIVEIDRATADYSKSLSEKYHAGWDLMYLRNQTLFTITQAAAGIWLSRDVSSKLSVKLQLQRVDWLPVGAGAIGNNLAGIYLVYSD